MSANNLERSESASDATVAVVSAFEDEQREKTLTHVFEDENIVRFGKDGELSQAQRGLVAAVVSLMQDELLREREERLDDAHRETNRIYAFLVGGIRTFFHAKVLSPPAAKAIASPPETWRQRILGWLTWGNVSAGALVIAICSFAWFSGSYANYKKEAVDNAASVKRLLTEKDDLTKKLSDADADVTKLTAERDTAVSTAATYKDLSEQNSAKAFDTTSSLGQMQEENRTLQTAKVDLEQRISKLEGKVTSQTQIAANAQANYKKQLDLTSKATNEINSLNLQIANLKTRCGRDCDQ